MKIKAILPVFAVIAALAFALSISAFTDKPDTTETPEKSVTTKYFKYTGPDNEADYKNPAFWTPLLTPGDVDPCPGDEYVCIMRTDDVPSGTVNDLITHLSNTVLVPSAQAYCNAGSRVIFEQEEQ